MTDVPSLPGLPVAPRFVVRHGSLTHVGAVRTLNEDRCFVAPELGVYAVADGMGGHAAGDIASTAVVQALASIGPAVTAKDLLARLEDRMLQANAAIRAVAEARGQLVGTTVAILIVFGSDFACLWAGDSRIYRIRDGAIAQLTHDHTEVQILVDSGALTPQEARDWPRRNVITRAVGVRPEPELELVHCVLEPGDTFVICSDGLTTHVEDAAIRDCAYGAEPQAACEALVGLALERGGSDNVTVVAVRFDAASDAATEREIGA
ncbi:PP2C-family Ser/Thr phosphatase [Methylobacterium cerastii]|uniref:PP2C-family Ser/Thr phosphatase n=1 Tax=Methylobacterium cerastii TaxID=932741 RepID=A0ABQ4QL42_9HYPH|nr:protein phosphatase 2C domain-containing protein [Methylobacterium cerastii]GJD45620.1 PP2C-family Ser/Thr phosphatase [Methylobacterium cerastii]